MVGKKSDSFLREAMLWKTVGEGNVSCFLCSHRCKIKPGQRGICTVRENRNGTLFTLVFGRAVANHVDPIEKKPLFHFMPGSLAYSIATMGCNFRCSFCQNWSISQGSQEFPGKIPGEWLPPERVVKEALAAGCQSVSYTYTEPTVFFEYAYETALIARKNGLKNSFVTNGFQTPETVQAMSGVIDAANVDLKSYSDDFYRKLCGAHLQPVLDTIKNLHRSGILVEITTLVIPGSNDSQAELRSIADFLAGLSPEIPWHVSRFHPDFQSQNTMPTPVEKIYEAVEIGKSAGLYHVYAGNILRCRYENTQCPSCKKPVIERQGYTLGPLHLRGSCCGHCGTKINFLL